MGNAYLQDIIKGQTFTLNFAVINSNFQFGSPDLIRISKDGGVAVNVTNSPTGIGSGAQSLVLTATEMNADIISIQFFDTISPKGDGMVTIYTTSDELSTMPDKNSTLGEKITFLFQYFRNRRTVTATETKLFKEDETTELGSGVLDDDGTTFDKGEIK